MNRKTDWSKVIFCIALVVSVVGLAGLAYASSEAHGGGMDKVRDLWLRIMNFAGLVVILVWALKKPIANGLSSRRQEIQDQFDNLEAQKNDAELLYKEYEAKLSTIDSEIKNIIDAAIAQGETEKQKIIDEANRAAGDIKRQAEMAIQHELALATQRLREDVADQAVKMAEEIITKNLQPEDQVRLVEGSLDKVGGIQ